jgi:hypothetical protein
MTAVKIDILVTKMMIEGIGQHLSTTPNVLNPAPPRLKLFEEIGAGLLH